MRPFKSGELVRNRWTYCIGRTEGSVDLCDNGECDCAAADSIRVAWRGGVTASIHVDALEHIQEFGAGAIIRNGMGRFEVPGVATADGDQLKQYDSWAEAMAALRLGRAATSA